MLNTSIMMLIMMMMTMMTDAEFGLIGLLR